MFVSALTNHPHCVLTRRSTPQRRFGKRQYEADKSLQRIFKIVDGPLTTAPVYGRPVRMHTLGAPSPGHPDAVRSRLAPQHHASRC